jgi:hypothetical protein
MIYCCDPVLGLIKMINKKLARKKLERAKKDDSIQVLISTPDKEALEMWCYHHDTNMSAVIREKIKPLIEEGKTLLIDYDEPA